MSKAFCQRIGRSGDLSDQLNLDASPKWNLSYAKRTARMHAFVTEDLTEKLARAICHQVLFGKVGVELTKLMTLTMRVILLRSPTAACSVPIRSIAAARAANWPSAVSMPTPSCPAHGLPSFLAMCPDRKTNGPVWTYGT